jgi:tetratricopeptide (TPR) repeat protein
VATPAHHLRPLRTIILSLFAAFLAWQVVSKSFAAYFAEIAPEIAFWLAPGQPLALVNLADHTLNVQRNAGLPRPETSDQTSQKGVTANVVRAWADSALMQDPLNARALRILGQLAIAENNEADALKFMQVAARLSLHESAAVYWLVQNAAKAKDYKTVIYYANALLRIRPDLGDYVLPLLARIAEDKGSNKLLESVLSDNPPWRGQFLERLPASVTDLRTPLYLLLALKASASPPTSADVAPYIKFLIELKQYELAYYTWLQFLSADELRSAGLLFNGRFDVVPSGMPFDWVITQGSGVTIDIVSKPGDGEHALLVDFAYGRVDYRSVTQLLMLAPGTYEFKGEYKGELIGPRGLKWRIVCAGGAGTRVGESSMIVGTTPQRKTVAFNFTIPAKDCRAQYVQLDLDARMASEQLVSGSVLFDDLQILRVENPS